MKQSYLIQRLQAPTGEKSISAFGAGNPNGGLSDEAIDSMKDLWRFDYMGSSEFEWGAVPDAFAKIKAIPKRDLIFGSIVLKFEYNKPQWGKEEAEQFKGKDRVYYLCSKGFEEEIQKRLKNWASEDYNENVKETILLNQYMSSYRSKFDRNIQGWIELDNGFMFFVDAKMWRGACDLFGVRTPSKKRVSRT